MSVGSKWLRRADAAAAAQVGRMLDSAERDLGALLPQARIERGASEIRFTGRQQVQRWLADPALRFLLWRQQ